MQNQAHPEYPPASYSGNWSFPYRQPDRPDVISRIVRHADEVSFEVLDLSYSPIRGPEGNIEYLIHLRKNPERTVYPDIPAVFEKKIKEIVEEAHQELEKP